MLVGLKKCLKEPTMPKITHCMWFNGRAEEPISFYKGIFKNSKILKIAHYGKNMLCLRAICW